MEYIHVNLRVLRRAISVKEREQRGLVNLFIFIFISFFLFSSSLQRGGRTTCALLEEEEEEVLAWSVILLAGALLLCVKNKVVIEVGK
jgi:hypothetical protein